jgi:hypothetical protein
VIQVVRPKMMKAGGTAVSGWKKIATEVRLASSAVCEFRGAPRVLTVA